MSLERTYMTYYKLIFMAIGAGLVADRMSLLLGTMHLLSLERLFTRLYVILTWPSLVMTFIVSLRFISDLKYIDKGIPVPAKEIIDPRIYMAAERTFLAWVRTGISLIAFGFVIEKFDFFLEKLSLLVHTKMIPGENFSHIGIIFILLGVTNLVLGGFNFAQTVKQVEIGMYHTHRILYIIYGIILLAATGLLASMVIHITP